MNLLGLDFRGPLAHLEMKHLMNYKGGVAAKSSERLSILISFPTIVDMYLDIILNGFAVRINPPAHQKYDFGSVHLGWFLKLLNRWCC